MARTATAKTRAAAPLPMGLTDEDLRYPASEDHDYAAGDHGQLTLYEVTDARRGATWVIATLGISKSRRGHADRTYGIRVDTQTICRVGNGPHVTRTLTVYPRKSRAKVLAPILELYTKGCGEAGLIRDRIGSRRAEGQLRRARGERSWAWDN